MLKRNQKVTLLVAALGMTLIFSLIPGLIEGGNIDKCTEKYNYCIASCATQQKQCLDRGNDSKYCGDAYSSCANGCKRRMEDCWKE